jgi:hypothetical protein
MKSMAGGLPPKSGKHDLFVGHVNDNVACAGSIVHGGHNLRWHGPQNAPPISPENRYRDLAVSEILLVSEQDLEPSFCRHAKQLAVVERTQPSCLAVLAARYP